MICLFEPIQSLSIGVEICIKMLHPDIESTSAMMAFQWLGILFIDVFLSNNRLASRAITPPVRDPL